VADARHLGQQTGELCRVLLACCILLGEPLELAEKDRSLDLRAS
jgi:hypothetical protein